MAPYVTHNAVGEITVKGRPHSLYWEIVLDDWEAAFRNVAALFARNGRLTQDVVTGEWKRGRTLLERMREGADA